MTLTDSVAVRMYEQRIDTLEGEVYSLQRDNEHLSREVKRLEHERDAAQDHAKGQSAEVQRYKLMYQETSRKYIAICKEISQIRHELVSLQVEYDETERERERLQNIVYRLKGAS